MKNSALETSPIIYAKAAGYLYLVLLICGPFSLIYVPSALIVAGDAGVTASNIIASESLFRMSLISDSIIFLSEIALTVLVYVLFKPVSKTLSLIAAFSRLAMATIQGINLLNHLIVLLLLSGADYLNVFDLDELHALALLFLNLHSYVSNIWGAFFGLHCFVLGYLLFKSGYFPKILGVLLVFSSLGYLIQSFGNFLLPSYEGITPIISGFFLMIGTVGEISFMFWLLFKGLDIQKWEQKKSREFEP